jgi:hypothetical protein
MMKDCLASSQELPEVEDSLPTHLPGHVSSSTLHSATAFVSQAIVLKRGPDLLHKRCTDSLAHPVPFSIPQ